MTHLTHMLERAGHPLSDEQLVLVSAYEAAMRVNRKEALEAWVVALNHMAQVPNDVHETRSMQAYLRLLSLL